MSYSQTRYWRRFSDKIVAISNTDGLILHDFIQQSRINKTIFNNYEILDFQRYRIIRKPSKIADFIFATTPAKQRFRFLINKN